MGPLVGGGGGDAGGEVEAGHGGDGAGFVDEAGGIFFEGGQHAAHDAAGAEVADECAGVEIVDHGDAGVGEEGVGLGVGAPIAGDGGKLADDEAFDVGVGGLVIAGGGAVISDLGVGEDDDLAGIGRIGEYFLIAGEGGVEDDLS